MSIVDLEKERENRTPHLAGEALCLDCKHVWQAVAPVGTEWLECPSCKLHRGHYRFHCEPEGKVWTCPCGNDLFYITEKGNALCPNCGEMQPLLDLVRVPVKGQR